MCGRNCQPCQRCQRCRQPNTSSRISASGVKDADFVESFLRRWHSRSCFRIDGQKIYREPKGKIVRKTFKYRLYPTRPQSEALMVQLSEACRLYNAALQERIEAYRTHHKSINYYDQAAPLTEIRKAGDLGLPNCHCAQDVLRRLEKAFEAFFQRIKRGQKPGFPRFKSSRRYDSITFPSHGDGQTAVQWSLRARRRQHQSEVASPLHGKIKTVSVKRECEHWYVCFSVETSVQPLPETKAAVGIDLGLSSFATLSDDAEIENPRLYRQAQKKLRRAQRRVARRKKGSK